MNARPRLSAKSSMRCAGAGGLVGRAARLTGGGLGSEERAAAAMLKEFERLQPEL